jgi:hypothetical protein
MLHRNFGVDVASQEQIELFLGAEQRIFILCLGIAFLRAAFAWSLSASSAVP